MSPVQLLDLAAALADGAPIDWERIAAGMPADLADRARIIERIAHLHATLPPSESFAASLRGTFDPGQDRSGSGADTPATWGALTIVERIGRGTFGDVYRARDPRLDRPVALKLLRHKDQRESAVIEEARLLARVRHPNVVTVHGAERIDGRVGLWMEFIDGPTLEQELKTRGPFSPDELVNVGAKLASALAAVHRAGLLHRDLKAQNVMRDADGRVLLTDFGAGHELAGESDARTLALAGTPLYLAPEVLDGLRASPASDVYSLGVLLYHLASGQFPVRGRTIRDLRDAHARGARVPLKAAARGVPDALGGVIERTIEPDPARRFESAAAVETALLELAAGRRWRPRAVLATSALAVLAVVAGAWSIGSRSDPPAAQGAAAQLASRGSAAGVPSSSSNVTFMQMDTAFQSRVNIRMPSDDSRYVTCTPWGHGSVAICDLLEQTVREIRVPAPGRERSPNALLSPDLQRVAYVWTQGPQAGIRVIGADGSNDRELFRAVQGHDAVLVQWLRANDTLIVLDIDPAAGRRLLSVPVEGGSLTELHSFDTGANVAYVQLSDDERFLIFDRQQSHDDANRDVIIVEMSTGRETPLVASPSDDYGPRWAPDNRAIVFASDRFGSRALLSVPVKDGRAAGAPVLLRDMGRSTITPMGFSRDGTLFLRLFVNWLDVFRAPIDPSAATIGTPLRVDPRSIDENISPDWSPDGSRIAYLSGAIGYTQGVVRVEIHRSDGSVERVIPLSGGLPRSARVRWSPDGMQLAVSSLAQAGAERVEGGLDLIDIDTGRTKRVLSAPAMWELKWDPLGNGLYYGTGLAIHRFDLGTGKSALVYESPAEHGIDNVLTTFDVSPDGRSIAFIGVSDPGRTVRVLTIADGTVTDRYHFRFDCRAVAWSRDGSRLLVSASHEKTPRPSLFVMDVTSGEPIPLNAQTEYIVDFSLRHDDRELLFATGNPRPDIWTLRGFKGSEY